MTALTWIWDNRTKLIGYLGMFLAQLGTSGLVGGKTAGWCAFGASFITTCIGHFNDYQKRKEATE